MSKSKYDDTELTLTFTYREWSLIGACMREYRDSLHTRADRLEVGGFADVEKQTDGIRRKAGEILGLIDDVGAGQADVRAAARAIDAARAAS